MKVTFLQTVVKEWFRDKDSGFLENGSGPDNVHFYLPTSAIHEWQTNEVET